MSTGAAKQFAQLATEGHSLGLLKGVRKYVATQNSLTPIAPFSADAAAEIDLYLEAPLQMGTAFESEAVIDTPFPRTKVKVRGHVVGVAQPGSHSPSYLAARRRERCRKILNSIVQLEHKADKADFHIWTHEPLSLVKRLIHFLDNEEQFAEEEHEGNACEILRQVRDSFLRNGWQKYRATAVRDAVARILRHLATDEVITAQLADESLDVLLDIGLSPIVMEPIGDDQEEDAKETAH